LVFPDGENPDEDPSLQQASDTPTSVKSDIEVDVEDDVEEVEAIPSVPNLDSSLAPDAKKEQDEQTIRDTTKIPPNFPVSMTSPLTAGALKNTSGIEKKKRPAQMTIRKKKMVTAVVIPRPRTIIGRSVNIVDRLGGVIEFARNRITVNVLATFDLKLKGFPYSKVSFRYIYYPDTNEEVVFTEYGKDLKPENLLAKKIEISKVGLAFDKSGNLEATQFLLGLPKLSAKYDGKIFINEYTLYWEKEMGQRLKIQSVDVSTNPVSIEMVAAGVVKVAASGSTTDLRVQVQTELQTKWKHEDAFKSFRIDGPNAKDILIGTTDERGGLFFCIPLDD